MHAAMTDLMVPSKRPRASSFSEKHPDYSQSHEAAIVPAKKEMAHIHLKNFLELCRFCSKNLCHNEDVFMYGYLGAFCSKVCRQKQIACDIFCELPREKAKAKKGRTSLTKPNLQSQDEGFTSSRFYI